jgi:hypothetical protein
MISTLATYEETLDWAIALLSPRVAGLLTAIPPVDVEKTTDDALNNVWVEGITVAEWVERAADRLGIGGAAK